MAEAANPYAPPTAEVGAPREAGDVFREGRLLRMDRHATLPPRCVSCNAPATKHVDRTLYWSHPAWRAVAWGLPALLVLLTFSRGELAIMAMTAFWPVVILLAIVHTLVRRKLALEIPLCARHARVRTATTWIIWLAIASTVAMVVAVFTDFNRIPGTVVGSTGLGLVLLMGVTALVRSFSAAERIGLRRLDAERAWLKRTGEAFRASFPEAS